MRARGYGGDERPANDPVQRTAHPPPQLRTASENRAGATADSVSSELGGYLPPVVARAPRPDGFVPVVLDSVGIRAKLSVPGIVLGGPESDASALAAARSAPLDTGSRASAPRPLSARAAEVVHTTHWSTGWDAAPPKAAPRTAVETLPPAGGAAKSARGAHLASSITF